jgi:formate hydrogenlyase transcriptional activator
MVGRSMPLQKVVTLVDQVARTDACVLIEGETGTGKELIARAIHGLSDRRERPFVKLNCAAIPTGLLETELFGHERGAFTGAVAQKSGQFEAANHGTIFLDEIGEILPEVQVKLLRVLEQKEFQRLGSTRTVRVDVRVVAATNRTLSEMVERGEFRSDLFYRLNVFPIVVPPLRERPGDIPDLVWHFVRHYARKYNKGVNTIERTVMGALTTAAWPGNIRQLENFIERSVILSHGSILEAPIDELEKPERAAATPATLDELKREHIVRALDAAGWVLSGPRGAAAKLGMKRTTLQHVMRKLGIRRRA